MNRLFRKFTFWLTLFAVLLCLYHLAGFDHDNIVFLMFSPVTWVIPIFADVNRMDVFFLYATTIIVWFAAGYAIDTYAEKYGKRKSPEGDRS